jgi:hypothetical protein
MSDFFQELKLKFRSIETKIEHKLNRINNLYKEEIELLNETFNIESLLEKYSKELNSHRDLLLNQISFNLDVAINQVNETRKNNESNKLKLEEFKKIAKFKFKRSLKSENACIWRLLSKEYKFESKFSASKLAKYQNILGFDDLMKKQNSSKYQIKEYNNLANKHSKLEAIKIVKGEIDANAKYSDENTALIIASNNGQLEILKYLVEIGADVNSTNKWNSTALILASAKDHFEIVKNLVENEADVNAKDDRGSTALLLASENGHFEIFLYLFENGADVNAKDEDSNTALILASLKGHDKIVKYLVEKCMRLNLKYEFK